MDNITGRHLSLDEILKLSLIDFFDVCERFEVPRLYVYEYLNACTGDFNARKSRLVLGDFDAWCGDRRDSLYSDFGVISMAIYQCKCNGIKIPVFYIPHHKRSKQIDSENAKYRNLIELHQAEAEAPGEDASCNGGIMCLNHRKLLAYYWDGATGVQYVAHLLLRAVFEIDKPLGEVVAVEQKKCITKAQQVYVLDWLLGKVDKGLTREQKTQFTQALLGYDTSKKYQNTDTYKILGDPRPAAIDQTKVNELLMLVDQNIKIQQI